jgi:hypothetical protein
MLKENRGLTQLWGRMGVGHDRGGNSGENDRYREILNRK